MVIGSALRRAPVAAGTDSEGATDISNLLRVPI
jgi:hypothetical protein